MKRTLHVVALLMLFAVAPFVTGCEDNPPNAYIARNYVEAYLIVDRPIEGVVVSRTQPLTEPYEYGNGAISDAQVVITGGGKTYPLQYRQEEGTGSYYYPDTTALIQPETEYHLEVRLSDGNVITATTVTPQRIEWVKPPKDAFQYPSDTTSLPIVDSLGVSWTKGNNNEYLIRITVLDTLNYGAYLDPPTNEINERTNANGETDEDRWIYSKVMWGFVQAPSVPVVWSAFRWYGLNEIAILAADTHFLNWFKVTKFSGNPVQYDSFYSNIEGGVGVFGSAAILTHNSVLLKREK